MSLLQVGVSGLTSHQTALTTVGNNISNANVEGYSRQEAEFGSRASQRENTGYIGAGVQISTIRRITNQFTINQLQSDISRSDGLTEFSDGLSELDNLLANESTGLTAVMDDLFAAIQSASESPTALPLREQVLGEAERLVSRYQDINNYLTSSIATINESIDSTTSEVNRLTSSIAQINQSISSSTLPNGATANDLLDQRDRLLRELSSKINISTVAQDGTNVNVYLSSGDALVLGSLQNDLVAIDSKENASRLDIAVQIEGGSPQSVGSAITGGLLGGQLRLLNEGFDQVANEVGLVMTSAVNAFNVINQQGVDVNQQTGLPIFTDINERTTQLSRVAYGADNSSSVSSASVAVTDPQLLQATDYSLTFGNNGLQTTYDLIRQSDGASIQQGVVTGTVPQTITSSDGFSVTLETNDFSSGDILTLSPAQLSSDNVAVQLQSGAALAFGLPLSTIASGDNQGSGSIKQPVSGDLNTAISNLFSGSTTPTQTPLLIRFTSQTSFDVLDNTDPDNPVALVPAVTGLSFAPGATNTLFTANNPIQTGSPIVLGFDIQLSGVPEAGDEFLINPGFAGQGDNRNALAFASIQRAELVNDSGSLTDMYASLVASVGVTSASAKIDSEAASALRTQTEQRLQSESGVNLDEEAARLLQYEQAYNASAQVISIARSIFDSLLSAFR